MKLWGAYFEDWKIEEHRQASAWNHKDIASDLSRVWCFIDWKCIALQKNQIQSMLLFEIKKSIHSCKTCKNYGKKRNNEHS